MPAHSQPPPACIQYEDEHILVASKPPGINTHSPGPYAGEGLYEWLKNTQPRRADLAIIHRLDKATSGLMVFANSRVANQSLTRQFAERQVRKRYLLLGSNPPPEKQLVARCPLVRTGERYSPGRQGEFAETAFEYLGPHSGFHLVAAEPLTGRTHQIRVHAQLHGFPILGDTLYGGAPFSRVCLHAQRLAFHHPETGRMVSFEADVDFRADRSLLLRGALIAPGTTAFRLLHGLADDIPGVYAEILGDYLLAQSAGMISPAQAGRLRKILASQKLAGMYFKFLSKTVRRTALEEAAPALFEGSPAPPRFEVRENGVLYEMSFQQGYSAGLFLDQRENRRRILNNYVAPHFELFDGGLREKEVLNTFAYTCAFSVCAALSGARTTSLDLSRKYLEWGKRNFNLNNLDPAQHEFIFGDVFDWAARLAKKGRRFDLILLDPPTFSQAKGGAVFQAEKHYGKLITAVLPLLRRNGILFASTNAHRVSPESFLGQIFPAIHAAGRKIVRQHYVPQPFDFPISGEDPAYLKTVWLRLD